MRSGLDNFDLYNGFDIPEYFSGNGFYPTVTNPTHSFSLFTVSPIPIALPGDNYDFFMA